MVRHFVIGAVALFAFCLVSSEAYAASAVGGAPRSISSVVRGNAWISAEADRLSGRNLNVTCADSAQGWLVALGVVGLPAANADQYYGFSLIQEGEMHLSPYVCEGLQLGINRTTRASNELQVAWSTDVLLHESVHMGRFTSDEALTEACARVGLPGELHRLYGIAYHSAELERLTSSAAFFRGTMGPAYQGGVCG